MPNSTVYVAILDDHQSIIDGYSYRLRNTSEIKVVATALYGEELDNMLINNHIDVLLIDLSVQTSPKDTSPFPVLSILPNLLQKYPHLKVLVISMYAGPGLMRMIMEKGVNGYITKDDNAALRELGNIVLSISDGDIYYSEKVINLYRQYEELMGGDKLTPRQIEALSLCAIYPDLSTSDLAEMLSVSNSTARNLLSSAYIRLGVHSRIAAVEMARELGLIAPHLPLPGQNVKHDNDTP